MSGTWLLVEVDDDDAALQLIEDLGGYPHVTLATEHGRQCCCKNCPWKGDHGWK